MVLLLDNETGFPDPRHGEPDGLFAVGGDLSPERLLVAYSYGIFPWYAFRPEDTDPGLLDPATGLPYIQWWCPMQRFVIFTDEIHVSHSMRQMLHRLERGELKVTYNQAFQRVLDGCSTADGRDQFTGAWLGDDMKAAYLQMHEYGIAQSVEVWEGDELIGGLYGMLMERIFVGESMFSLRPSASKLALITLARRLSDMGISLIDCQLETPHLRSMGGRFIPYDEYIHILGRTLPKL